MSRRRRQQRRVVQPSAGQREPGTSPATGATLAALVTELRRAQHRAAVLEHLGQLLFNRYSAEEDEPEYLVTIGEDAPVVADSDALIEVAAVLAQGVDVARKRVVEIAQLRLPGGGVDDEDDGGVDVERFLGRVVRSSTSDRLERR